MSTLLDLEPLDRGDTWVNNFAFTDTDGNVVNITGYKFWMTFKINPNDADDEITSETGVQASTTANDANSVNGLLVLRFEATDTENLTPGTYQYDFQMMEGTSVTTLLRGKVKILGDITRSIT